MCAVGFVAVSLQLHKNQENMSVVLRNATLFYAKSDTSSNQIAQWLNTNLHIHLIEASSPKAGQEVFELTGLSAINSPTLVLQRGKGAIYVSGVSAIRQWFSPILDQVKPLQRARIALMVMFCIMLLAYVLKEDVAKIISFLPILGITVVGSLQVSCLTCNMVTLWSNTFVPLFLILYLLIGLFLFSLPRPYPRRLYQFYMSISGLIPILQALLQLEEPKLCLICLLVTFIASCYFFASLQLCARGIENSIACPRGITIGIVGLLLVFGARSGGIVLGLVQNKEKREVTVPRIIGKPLANFISQKRPIAGTLLVVTMFKCHSCDIAVSELAKTQISWQAVPLCGAFDKGSCFDPQNENFPTPLFLICDSQGLIAYQHEGWVGTKEERDILFNEIAELQKKWRPITH